MTRIPAALGRVKRITVQVRCEALPEGAAVDVTDLVLTPGDDPIGVVPHPSDLAVGSGRREYRNGIVTRSDPIVALANVDEAAPVRLRVRGAASVRVGAFSFGRVSGSASVDGAAGTATQGYGRAPIITRRSDLHTRVTTDRPVHVTVEWADRS
ncbi:hypothetical protein A9Z40_03165 [Microbacterium arborescens]|uniref:Uncharacterized protein n=1 Tax=Microbacterium arborescens TaxID=33883 RepID=A0ABX2WJH5_9MICO|nr:hypothetical protein [Microbacterium arborescens]OAZ40955.1 hypothetical protein A9Z40_03165 [Microbacterium arborescens]